MKAVKVVRYRSLDGKEYLNKLSALKADLKFKFMKIKNDRDETWWEILFESTIDIIPLFKQFEKEYNKLSEKEKENDDNYEDEDDGVYEDDEES